MLRDFYNSMIRPGLIGFTTLALVSARLVFPLSSDAAEPDFVGVLALALEDEVARKINLSAGVRAKLLEVIDRREDEALEVVLAVRDLPEAQRAARLAPFRAESERRGLALLTERQRRQLRAMQVSRNGMASLGEADVSLYLGVSPTQQKQIGQLLEQRAEAMANVDRQKQQQTRAAYERKLAAVLTVAQQDRLKQLSAATLQPPEGSDEASLPRLTFPVSGPDPATGGAATTSPTPDGQDSISGDGRLQFSFQYAPWRSVLEWFASQADLSLVMDVAPVGTLNYVDRRRYTPAEAIDLLNSVLLTKGYTLVRRDRMLMLINLEDGIPPNLVSQLLPDQLDDRGEYELVSCLFTLKQMTPEDAETEISSLLGPQGSVALLPTSRQILVTETAGKLRMIRKVIETVADRNDREVGKTTAIALQHASAEEVLVIARQLFGFAEDQNMAPDGSLRMAADPISSRLIVTGSPHMVSRLDELVDVLDTPFTANGLAGVIETPQLETYSIATADPTSVLQVLQTLMAGMPDVRLSKDPKTGNVVALARPSQHRTIQATIDQMQRDARQIEVIRLWSVDPQLAVTSINRLFGTQDDDGNVDPSAPLVESDPMNRSLLIRASLAQVTQIRTLLEKMGEGDAETQQSRARARGNVRMLPITARRTKRLLEQIGVMWPTMRRNRVRVVTPAAAIQEMRPGRDMAVPRQPKTDVPHSDPPTGEPSDDEARGRQRRGIRPASDVDGRTTGRAVWLPRAVTALPASIDSAENESRVDSAPADVQAADILVAPGPREVMIASQDTEALDEFEGLLRALGERTGGAQNELAVFYLRYAQAEVAAELLKPFLGLGGSGDAGGGSLLGSLAGAALGDAGGGLVGSLLGLGGGGGASLSSSGSTNVLADSRLNALVVQASPDDLDLIEQLLEVIDQDRSPEDVQTVAKPRFIPVLNMGADEAAATVREIYAARLSPGAGQPQQPTPEEFLRALRGGRNEGSGARRKVEEQERMVVSVDSRSNSLIVSAPDPLFQDVQDLVSRIDELASEHISATRVVTLRRTNPLMLQKALTALLGDAVRKDAKNTGSNGIRPSPDGRQQTQPAGAVRPQSPTPQQIREQMRRRMEFFNALQRAGQAGQGKPPSRGKK